MKKQIIFGCVAIMATICWAVTPQWVNVKDYGAVGNGTTDDTTAIRNAINAGGNAASTIYFPPGTYVTTYIPINYSNRTLLGSDAILKCKDNYAGPGCSDNSNWIVVYDCDNIVIKELTFDGNRENNTGSVDDADHTIVSDILTLQNCDNVRVVNCNFLNSSDSSVMLSACRDARIINNYFNDSTDLAIYVNNNWSLRGDNDSNALADCIISNNIIMNMPGGGIGLKRVSRRTIISDNIIHHCGNGITMEHASTDYDFSKEVTINGNQIRHIGNWTDQSWYSWYPWDIRPVAGRGINLRCSDFSVVANNRIEDCYCYSIMIEGSKYCSVMGNVVKGSSTDKNNGEQIGLYVCNRSYTDENNQSQTVKTMYCTFMGNSLVSHYDYGIYQASSGGEYNTYTGNIARYNTINRSVTGTGCVQTGNIQ